MNAGLRGFAMIAGGAVAALVVSWLVTATPADERDDLLRELAERQGRLDVRAASTDPGATQAVVMQQFYRLHEFRRLGEEGQAVAWVVPVPEGRTADPIASAAGGSSIRIPRLALDPAARDTWTMEVARLSGFEGAIDDRIFTAFADVRAFVQTHPWPGGSGLTVLRGSEWASPDVIERWLSLNRALVSRVDALLAGL